jgi:hypothetical protein
MTGAPEELEILSIDVHTLITILRALAAQRCVEQTDPEMALRVLFERANRILDDLGRRLNSTAQRDYHEKVRAAVTAFFIEIDKEIKRQF